MKYPKIICPKCNMQIPSNNYKRHVDTCNGEIKKSLLSNESYHVDHEGLNCKFCGKECKNLNSLTQHELRCRENPTRKCYNSLGNWAHNTLKGETKETNEIIAKQATTIKRLYDTGELIPYAKGKPGTFKGKQHTYKTKQKIGSSVSKSRIEGYKNGTITPAKGVGKGKYSYIIYNNKKYMLRSTFEFIYAIYLLQNNIKFNMEDIRLPAYKENKYAKTFICDFNLYELNKIIEIKGIASEKDEYVRETFEQAGYEFEIYYKDTINEIKNELITIGYDINYYLDEIKKGHESKNYFVYTFNKPIKVI